MRQFLGDRADDLDPCRFGESREFFERVGDLPGGAVLVDGDEKGMLLRLVGTQCNACDRSSPYREPL
jgi:hypothetical protein